MEDSTLNSIKSKVFDLAIKSDLTTEERKNLIFLLYNQYKDNKVILYKELKTANPSFATLFEEICYNDLKELRDLNESSAFIDWYNYFESNAYDMEVAKIEYDCFKKHFQKFTEYNSFRLERLKATKAKILDFENELKNKIEETAELETKYNEKNEKGYKSFYKVSNNGIFWRVFTFSLGITIIIASITPLRFFSIGAFLILLALTLILFFLYKNAIKTLEDETGLAGRQFHGARDEMMQYAEDLKNIKIKYNTNILLDSVASPLSTEFEDNLISETNEKKARMLVLDLVRSGSLAAAASASHASNKAHESFQNAMSKGGSKGSVE